MPTALVIHASRAIRIILGRILSALGFEAVQAASGAEGLTELDRHFPEISLVLVDWNMPGMSGLDFLKEVRAQARYAPVVLIVVTETPAEGVVEAIEAGASSLLAKPFTEEIIASKLRLLGVLK